MTNQKYLRPELDTLYTVALKNLEPRKTKDQTGAPQLEWLLSDGRRM